MKNEIKVGIALEGGGAKGAYQIGVLKALKELNIKYDCVVGTSIGALNGVFFALGDYYKSSELWSGIDFSYSKNTPKNKKSSADIFDLIMKNIDKFEKNFMTSKGIDPEPIIDYYKEIIDEESIRKSKVEFGLTTYCLTDRKSLRLFKEDIPYGMMPEFVFASCYLPNFTAKTINGKYYLDGSMFSKLPVEMAVEKGCNIVIAVRLRPKEYNYDQYEGTRIIDIAPDEYLSSTLEASKERIKWMIKKGYEDAKKILSKEKHLIY